MARGGRGHAARWGLKARLRVPGQPRGALTLAQGSSTGPADAHGAAQGGLEAAQARLGSPALLLAAGQLSLQPLRPALGRAQAQAQLGRFAPRRLHLQLQVAGIGQQLLLMAAGLLQAAGQILLPLLELALRLRQPLLQVLELGEGGKG